MARPVSHWHLLIDDNLYNYFRWERLREETDVHSQRGVRVMKDRNLRASKRRMMRNLPHGVKMLEEAQEGSGWKERHPEV